MRTWKPAEQRRIVRELVILTIMAWATQTLLAQWGFGAEAEGEEKFVAPSHARAARVEMRGDAIVNGAEVRLKDVAQWAESDDAAMREAGELVIKRFKGEGDSETIDVRDVKQTLSDAGVNLGLISFSGSMACRVRREGGSIVEESHDTLPIAVIDARGVDETAAKPVKVAAASRTLRDVLIQELSAHLGMPVEQLQVRFEAKDEKVTSLREGRNQFQITPQKARRLGNVSWDVTVTTGSTKKKHVLSTHVQAWQTQLVSTRPLSVKQVIQGDDVVEKRVLVDYVSEEAGLSRAQVVGQQAGREIPIGTVITPRVIHSVQLVRVGQLVTVMVENGRVQVKWVAEARENGNFGQMIRVRKPGTREEFTVVVTGPEQTKLSGGGVVDVTADARR